MQGSIALVGSGEYLSEMADLESSLLENGVRQGKKPIFLQIPTAAGQESDTRLHYWRELGADQARRIGVEPRFLPIFTRKDALNPEYASAIADAALVYLSGGDPHYLANSLVGTPVWGAIYENLLTGGSLAGCSAGAMVLSSQIPNFRFAKRPPTPGLNLLTNIRVIPHFDKFFRWIPESAAKILLDSSGDSVLIGIDEMTALIQDSPGDNWTVHGKSKVHVLSGAEPKQLVHGDQLIISTL